MLFFCSTAFAQDGFYLLPSLGVGIANAKAKYPPAPVGGPYLVASPTKNIVGFNGQLLVLYQLGNWQIGTGASFIRSGFSEQYEYGEVFPIYGDDKLYYYHVAVPLNIAYNFNIGSRFSVMPCLGGEVSYNYAANFNNHDNNNGNTYNTKQRFTDNDFNNQYQRTSLWGTVKIQAGYQLTDRTFIIAGPKAQYMLQSLLKTSYNYQKNYLYTFDIGIKWALRDNSRKAS